MIWMCGDVHAHFDHLTQALDAAERRPAALILLGDQEAPIPLHECMREVEERGVEWYWIIGNHDTDTKENYANLSDPVSMAHNIDGRVVVIEGVRVAGLGGIFRGEVWHPTQNDGRPTHASYLDYEKFIRSNANLKRRLTRKDLAQMQAVPPEQRHWEAAALDSSRQGKLLKHRSTIFAESYKHLAGEQADLLVTHEAPSCHRHGFGEIDNLAKRMGVKAAFHGHHHEAVDYSRHWDDLGFKAFGVGFRGITSWDPQTHLVEGVVPWDFDGRRRPKARVGENDLGAKSLDGGKSHGK